MQTYSYAPPRVGIVRRTMSAGKGKAERGIIGRRRKKKNNERRRQTAR